MKDVILEYTFDIERVIKKANKKRNTKDKIEANYIIDTFSEKVGIDSKKIKNAKIKTTEVLTTTSKKNNKPKNTRRRVTKDYIMTEKDRLKIIRQITVYTKINKVKDISRSIEIFEDEDLVKEGYISEAAELSNKIPLAKKLVPKN